jgi:hypothetical protein
MGLQSFGVDVPLRRKRRQEGYENDSAWHRKTISYVRRDSKAENKVAPSQPRPGSSIYDLDTPVTLIDLDSMENNIRQWQSVADRCHVKFRPHIKTHKIPEIALMQIAAGARGIVSAKVSEAEPFAAAGIEDICIAYPVFGAQKWQRLRRSGARIVESSSRSRSYDSYPDRY